jgi:hypothetical protein
MTRVGNQTSRDCLRIETESLLFGRQVLSPPMPPAECTASRNLSGLVWLCRRPIPDSHAPALANRWPSVFLPIASSVTITSRSTFPRKKPTGHARPRFPLRKFPEKFDSLGRGLTIAQRDAGERACPLFPQNWKLEAGCPLFA